MSDININFINYCWDQSIVPTLMEYIKIPNKSPHFDPLWQQHGFMNEAVHLIANWCKSQTLANMQVDIVQIENRTPVILIEIPGKSDETILLYGHLDKQPEMNGWDADLHPFKPVLRDNKLYGRGAADDGYAAFASLTAIRALQEQNIPHARCVILIEACEESGSYDLPFYIEALKDKIGEPSLVICLDSGCGNYEQMWVTTSLRGLTGGTLSIDVLSAGIHSGTGSGVVPNAVRILRQLLARIEDTATGKILLSDLSVTIPEERRMQAELAANVLGSTLYNQLPFLPAVQPETIDFMDIILNRTWRPALSVIGLSGLPSLENAGNVTIPHLKVKLSLRLPPTLNAETAQMILKKTLEENPPYEAKISFIPSEAGSGWNAPALLPWLKTCLKEASLLYFGKEAVYMGEGGSIPFMGMLGKRFPKAQFVITGVLGPGSNAHGPNEFLHIPTGKKLTACIAKTIAAHYAHKDFSR